MNEIDQRRRVAEEQRRAAKDARLHPAEAEDEVQTPSPEPIIEEPEEEPAVAAAPLFEGAVEDLLANSPGVKAFVVALDARAPACFRNEWLDAQAKRHKKHVLYALT